MAVVCLGGYTEGARLYAVYVRTIYSYFRPLPRPAKAWVNVTRASNHLRHRSRQSVHRKLIGHVVGFTATPWSRLVEAYQPDVDDSGGDSELANDSKKYHESTGMNRILYVP